MTFLALGFGVPFLRGVAVTLPLEVSDEEAVVGIGFGGSAGMVSFEGAWVLRIDLG